MARGLRDIFEEARRRRVFQTTGVYLVAIWGLSQGAVQIAPGLGVDPSIVRWILMGSLLLLPLVVLLAWRFDLSLDGVVRDPGDQPTLGITDLDPIATMPTALSDELAAGAVVVRWTDAGGGGAVIFREEFFVGRGAECRVRFYDPLVSRRHARIYPDAGVWMIEDLGSRNGSILDEKRIGAPVALALASVLRVNEAGPLLRLETVAPGEAARLSRTDFADAPSVAHVRAPATAARRASSAAPVPNPRPPARD